MKYKPFDKVEAIVGDGSVYGRVVDINTDGDLIVQDSDGGKWFVRSRDVLGCDRPKEEKSLDELVDDVCRLVNMTDLWHHGSAWYAGIDVLGKSAAKRGRNSWFELKRRIKEWNPQSTSG